MEEVRQNEHFTHVPPERKHQSLKDSDDYDAEVELQHVSKYGRCNKGSILNGSGNNVAIIKKLFFIALDLICSLRTSVSDYCRGNILGLRSA